MDLGPTSNIDIALPYSAHQSEADDPVTQADYFLKTMNTFLTSLGLTFEDISGLRVKLISGTTEQQTSAILALINDYFDSVPPAVAVNVVERLTLPTMRVDIQCDF
jgi:enamine deaminase RidA (YjgF/YER057c/UK114 family)